MEIRISVRSLVEFILRSGNIDNRRAAAPDNAMQEGGRIHRMIQRRMGADYHAEVPLRYEYETEKYVIVIEGRADGIILTPNAGGSVPELTDVEPGKSQLPELTDVESGRSQLPELTDVEPGRSQLPELADTALPAQTRELVIVTVDEIKGTYRELKRLKEAVPVHLAQAKCYAYIYGKQNGLKSLRVRLTYCNIETEELKYFHFEYSMGELEAWFNEILSDYRKWADFQYEWQILRTQSIKAMEFPFPYRTGQKDLVTYVYQTIYHKRKLFIEAPTGVGKTISTLFPSVKAVGEGLVNKIFYLTAKTITRTVAGDTIELMRDQGLRFKSVILTAKDKVCFMEETECNPEYCPFAKGHYDRINDAIYDMLTETDNFNRENIEKYARKHQVCPFEMTLDMSLFADAVIGDYNYLFDPHVYLKRFFSEGVRGDYAFLIDEAHNLVERGREMYSAVLRKEDFLALKRAVKEYDAGIYRKLESCNRELLSLKRECEDCCLITEEDEAAFARALMRLAAGMEDYLEEHEESPVREEILEFYFEVSHYLLIHEWLDKNYVIYTRLESDGGFMIRLFCVNPAENLRECMRRGRSTILFSATLLPINYYKELLGADPEDYEVYAHSVFDPERCGLFIAEDVTTKYTRRSDMEYYNIASYIYKITFQRDGNYLVFFPSYAFLHSVYEAYREYFLDETKTECLLQDEYMDEESRELFLKRFDISGEPEALEAVSEAICMEIEEEPDKTLLGFCVLGGVFGEGIDLKNDRLIGVIVVGTGIPQVCSEREILKQFFDERGENGFDYAYRYPGMNKVLQAAGRVIRTAQDVGIIALLDERFFGNAYLRMMPREWQDYERVSLNGVEKRIERFWNEWL